MSVIVDLEVPSQRFELGRILDMEVDTDIALETMVPLGERTVPFFRVRGGADAFERSVDSHERVTDIHVVSSHEEEILYALDWDISDDSFFAGLIGETATLLNARGVTDAWTFELRFKSHDSLSAFQEHCTDQSIPIDVIRLYNPTKPGASPWYGLSSQQRQALSLAVEEGYYSIPRDVSTVEVADRFDISDQAMVERLRRATRNLVMATLLVPE